MVAQSKLSQVFSYQNWVHAVSGAAVSIPNVGIKVQIPKCLIEYLHRAAA